MAALLLGAHWSAVAITYNCSIFSIPGGATHSTGMNTAGVIVGSFTPSGSTASQGFIRDAAGNVTFVNYPGAASTQLFNINNKGISVGIAHSPGAPPGTVPIAFTVDLNGNFQTIPLPPPYNQQYFFVYGINDNGYVSGWANSGASWFILSPSGAVIVADRTIPPPPGGALNNSLQLLEPRASGASVSTTELFQPGQSGVPINGYGTGLNNAGDIVGYQAMSYTGFGDYVPFLRDASGVYSEIVCPGIPHFDILPYAINDSGVIAGDDTAQSPTQSFIATPLPGLAQFTASASSVTFGPQPAGSTSPGQAVTITNTGTTRMDIGAMEFFTGTFLNIGPSQFHVSGCVDPTTGSASLDPGASCTITIFFAPGSAQPPGTTVTDRLIIDDSSPASPHIINVSGQVLGSTPPSPTPPLCTTLVYSAGPPRQVKFKMQDAAVGLSSIVVTDALNATATIPAFTPGDIFVLPTMTQTDPNRTSSITFQATNTIGLSAVCSATIAGGANQWSGLTGAITGRVVVVPDHLGTLEAFARGPDNSLWHASQTQVNGPWPAWESLGGVITSDPAVIPGPDGGLKVFAAGTDSAIWEIEQTEPRGAWSSWASLGGVVAGNPAVALSAGEAIDVFARGTDLALWHKYQMGPGGPWSDWTCLGGYLVTDPVVAQTISYGPINVFAQGGDHALWQIAEVGGGTETWTRWNAVGGGPFTGNPAVASDQAGVLEVLIRGADNALWYSVQSSINNPLGWTAWASPGGYVTSDPAAVTNQDGTVDVFVRGGDNGLWHIEQSLLPGGPFGAWTSLGGILGSSIAAVRDRDGRLEVYALAPDNTLWHIAQVFPGAWN